MASPNKELIDELQVILDQAKLSNLANDRFRIKSYRDAIDKIKGVTFKITIDSEIPLAKTSKIYAKVKEFIEKGQIHQSQKILTESEGLIDIYRDLQKIAEVGPAKAKLLVEEYGIRTIEQLSENINLLNGGFQITFVKIIMMMRSFLFYNLPIKIQYYYTVILIHKLYLCYRKKITLNGCMRV